MPGGNQVRPRIDVLCSCPALYRSRTNRVENPTGTSITLKLKHLRPKSARQIRRRHTPATGASPHSFMGRPRRLRHQRLQVADGYKGLIHQHHERPGPERPHGQCVQPCLQGTGLTLVPVRHRTPVRWPVTRAEANQRVPRANRHTQAIGNLPATVKRIIQ